LESLVNDPRLIRLASLWHQGLEAALSSAEEAELKALLADAALAEAWIEQQVGREEAQAAALVVLPGRLRSAFQRQFKPWTYWGLRVGLPALAVLAFLAWPRPKAPQGPQGQEARVDETPFQEEQSQPLHRAKKPDLGPPPGLDDRAHLWVSRTGKALQFEVDLRHEAQVEARIMNADGQKVRTLDLGRRAPGKTTVAWDGLAATGQRVPAGRYQARVYLDGTLQTEKDLVVERK
jgi:hypothetical protein